MPHIHRFLRLAQCISLVVSSFALAVAAQAQATSSSQMANLDVPPPLPPERTWLQRHTGLVKDDGTEIFRTLYDIKADGWSGSQLKIDSFKLTQQPATETAPAPAATGSDRQQLLSEFGAIECGQRT